MKWSLVCLVLSLALTGCAGSTQGGGNRYAQSGNRDYVKSGVIDIPGYSVENQK